MPGHRDGGPIRTISHMTELLGDTYDFTIACLDRDHGDVTPYPGVRPGTWHTVGKARVWYVTPGGFTESLILELSRDRDLIYLCSFYDDYGRKTLLLKRRGKIRIPVVLAAMGVFSKGALMQHACKKRFFIAASKTMGLFKGLTWSVSSAREVSELRRVIGKDAICVIAEDLPATSVPGVNKAKYKQSIAEDQTLKIVFLSRISPKKNLLGAINALQEVRHAFTFTIYGPIEDERYWRRCRDQLKHAAFLWSYQGDVPPGQVQEVFSSYDVFLFPTMGENYGHVIFEALSVGCIPIISDRTPWEEIQQKSAGFTLPLGDMKVFGQKIDEIIAMPQEARTAMAEAGVEIAKACVERNKAHTGYREVFG